MGRGTWKMLFYFSPTILNWHFCFKVSNQTVFLLIIGSYYGRAEKFLSIGALN
jgi:hypothetical protein